LIRAPCLGSALRAPAQQPVIYRRLKKGVAAMLELVVAGPIMTAIGVVVLGIQRRGIKAPTYIAPTSPAFDGVIAGCFVVVGLG
jgi:hypothetical protein